MQRGVSIIIGSTRVSPGAQQAGEGVVSPLMHQPRQQHRLVHGVLAQPRTCQHRGKGQGWPGEAGREVGHFADMCTSCSYLDQCLGLQTHPCDEYGTASALSRTSRGLLTGGAVGRSATWLPQAGRWLRCPASLCYPECPMPCTIQGLALCSGTHLLYQPFMKVTRPQSCLKAACPLTTTPPTPCSTP